MVSPFEVVLESGERLHCIALFPELGGPSGTLVVDDYEQAHRCAHELLKRGFEFSKLAGFNVVDPDQNSYLEMFADWGWNRRNTYRPWPPLGAND